MYKYCKDNSLKLLSDYNGTFWSEYKTNFTRYDFLFRRLFYSFFYFLQEKNEPISDIVTDFTNEVYAHLLANDKKYSELYRINVLDDTSYSLLDNYNVTETLQRENVELTQNEWGRRVDTSEVETGAHTDQATNIYGGTKSTTLNQVAPFDNDPLGAGITQVGYVSGMFPKDASTVNGDQHSDNMSTTYGSSTDTSEVVKGSQTDRLSVNDTEEYTLTKKGNIGVQTATDIIDKHRNYWSSWEFYEFIFKEIANELLRVEG